MDPMVASRVRQGFAIGGQVDAATALQQQVASGAGGIGANPYVNRQWQQQDQAIARQQQLQDAQVARDQQLQDQASIPAAMAATSRLPAPSNVWSLRKLRAYW